MVPLKEGSIRLGFTQSQVTNWLQDVEASVYARDENTVIRSRTATAANGNVEFRDTWVREFEDGKPVFAAGPWDYAGYASTPSATQPPGTPPEGGRPN